MVVSREPSESEFIPVDDSLTAEEAAKEALILCVGMKFKKKSKKEKRKEEKEKLLKIKMEPGLTVVKTEPAN